MAPGRARRVRTDWALGDLVLAKVKGYPAWPAQVEDATVWQIRSVKNKVFVVFFGPGKQVRHCQPHELSSFSLDTRNELLEKLRAKATPGMSEALGEITEELEWREHNPGQARRRNPDGSTFAIQRETNDVKEEVPSAKQSEGNHVVANRDTVVSVPVELHQDGATIPGGVDASAICNEIAGSKPGESKVGSPLAENLGTFDHSNRETQVLVTSSGGITEILYSRRQRKREADTHGGELEEGQQVASKTSDSQVVDAIKGGHPVDSTSGLEPSSGLHGERQELQATSEAVLVESREVVAEMGHVLEDQGKKRRGRPKKSAPKRILPKRGSSARKVATVAETIGGEPSEGVIHVAIQAEAETLPSVGEKMSEVPCIPAPEAELHRRCADGLGAELSSGTYSLPDTERPRKTGSLKAITDNVMSPNCSSARTSSRPDLAEGMTELAEHGEPHEPPPLAGGDELGAFAQKGQAVNTEHTVQMDSLELLRGPSSSAIDEVVVEKAVSDSGASKVDGAATSLGKRTASWETLELEVNKGKRRIEYNDEPLSAPVAALDKEETSLAEKSPADVVLPLPHLPRNSEGRGRGRGRNGRLSKRKSNGQSSEVPPVEPRLTRASSQRRNMKETAQLEVGSNDGAEPNTSVGQEAKSKSKALLQKKPLEKSGGKLVESEDKVSPSPSSHEADQTGSERVPKDLGHSHTSSKTDTPKTPANSYRAPREESKASSAGLKRKNPATSTNHLANSSVLASPDRPMGKRPKVGTPLNSRSSLPSPIGNHLREAQEPSRSRQLSGKVLPTLDKGDASKVRDSSQGKVGEPHSDRSNVKVEPEVGRKAAPDGAEHGRAPLHSDSVEDEKQQSNSTPKNSAVGSLQEAGEKLRKGYLREKVQKHNVKILEPESTMRSLLEAARARKEQRSLVRVSGTPPPASHLRGEGEVPILPTSPSDIRPSAQLSPDYSRFNTFANVEGAEEATAVIGDGTSADKQGPSSETKPASLSPYESGALEKTGGSLGVEGLDFPADSHSSPPPPEQQPWANIVGKGQLMEAELNAPTDDSQSLLEAEVARDTLASMLESLSRTRESIGKITRFAMDSLHSGTHRQLVELIVVKMETEESLHKRGDLFLLIDSISQASSKATKSGSLAASFLSDVESRLKRALAAAAPPGKEAHHNRHTCHKCLDLWLQREVLPADVLKPLLTELEERMKNDEANKEALVGGGSRRPLRSERGLDDPLREMGDILLDEYGSNTCFSLTSALGPSPEDVEESGVPTPDLNAAYERVKEEALNSDLENAEGVENEHSALPTDGPKGGHGGGEAQLSKVQNEQDYSYWMPTPSLPPPPTSPPPSPPPLPSSPPPSPPPLPPSSPSKTVTGSAALVQSSPSSNPLRPPPVFGENFRPPSAGWQHKEQSVLQQSAGQPSLYPAFPASSQVTSHFPYAHAMQAGVKPMLPPGNSRMLPPLPPLPPAPHSAPIPRPPRPPLPESSLSQGSELIGSNSVPQKAPNPPPLPPSAPRPLPQPQPFPPVRPPPPPGAPPSQQQTGIHVPQSLPQFRGQSNPPLPPPSLSAPFSTPGEVELSGGRTHVPPWIQNSVPVLEQQQQPSTFSTGPQSVDWAWSNFSDRGRMGQLQQMDSAMRSAGQAHPQGGKAGPGLQPGSAGNPPPPPHGNRQPPGFSPSAPLPPYGPPRPAVPQQQMQQPMMPSLPFMPFTGGAAPPPPMVPYPQGGTGLMPPHMTGGLHNIPPMQGLGPQQQQQQHLGVQGNRPPSHHTWGVSPP